jgi:hypothetical protein
MQRLKRLTFWGADETDDSLPRAVIAGSKTVLPTRSRITTSLTANMATAAMKPAT